MKGGLCGQRIMNEDTSDVVEKQIGAISFRPWRWHCGVRFDLSAVGTAFEGLKNVSHR